MATESVLLSFVIDAKEQRDVATVDIPGAFTQGDQDETVHMRLEGTLAELLVKCDPKLYRQYVVTENNKPVLYIELIKALYGTLRAALIFWRKLTSNLLNGVSSSIHTIGASPINRLTVNSVPWSGTLMT